MARLKLDGCLQLGLEILLLILVICLTGRQTNGQQNGEVTGADLKVKDQQSGRRSETTLQANKLQYLDANGQPVLVQFTYVGPPKILPIATADSYPEGSTINLICTVSGGQRRGLSLTWTVNGDEIEEPSRLKYLEGFENVAINQDDAEVSRLKINNATVKNSGHYTCTAKNPLGQDSTSVKIVINVEMKWTKTPKDQLEVGLNQELLLECDAIGSPQPTISWLRHANGQERQQMGSNDTVLVSRSKQLKVARVHHKDSALYECLAHNGVDDDLRKIIQVKVRGK